MSKDKAQKIPLTVLMTPEQKRRLGMAALMSGGRALTVEAAERLVRSMDNDNIPIPHKREASA